MIPYMAPCRRSLMAVPGKLPVLTETTTAMQSQE
jgi:hypothetical protein